jgi:hypothetical protein
MQGGGKGGWEQGQAHRQNGAPANCHLLEEICYQMGPGWQIGTPADCHLEEVCHQM